MSGDAFLIYNKRNGDMYTKTQLDHRGLSTGQIQQAIDIYIINQEDLRKENKRLEKLIDEILAENKKLLEVSQQYEKYRECVDSDY